MTKDDDFLEPATMGASFEGVTAGDPLESATVERVVDGDTLIVVTDDGRRERVRLIGVNAPESVAPEEERNCDEGRRASTWTHSHVPAGTRVWLQADVEDEDTYGRKLRYVWMERPNNPDSTREFRELTLNARLVAAGQAEAHPYPPNTTWDLLLEALGDQPEQPDVLSSR